MSRCLWLPPMLLALGLLASLVPQVTFASASSGELAGDVLLTWPGWGVQQDLGPLDGTVGTFEISLSAEPGGDELTVFATLVDATTREVVRAWTIEATPGYTPVTRSLTFPAYAVPEHQRLLLQLRVADFEHNYAIFGLASPQPEFANVMLNGVADADGGPLAFSHLETGSGLRAAVAGAPAERFRLVLAICTGLLALLMSPRVVGALTNACRSARVRVRRLPLWTRRLAVPRTGPISDSAETPTGGILSVPWYPWPIAAAPILHFLATNHLVFAAVEALFPLAVAIIGVTASVVILRVVLKDWHRSAAATTAVTIVIFAYGHAENAFIPRIDDRVIFSAAVVVACIAFAASLRASAAIAKPAPLFNLIALMLMAFPSVSIASDWLFSSVRDSSAESTSGDDITANLSPSSRPHVANHRPDIYYIIFDEYARHDSLSDFDNTDFLLELERRGFYVAKGATSNYMWSQQSIASLLNMSYLDRLGSRNPSRYADVRTLGQDHVVGAILKTLGYTYVHLASGHAVTDTAPLADLVVDFAPTGALVGENNTAYKSATSLETFLVGRFVREFIQTTALRPVLGHRLAPGDNVRYPWWHPNRTRQMFDYLTDPIDVDQPKFVLAHFLKPHWPPNLDRHGNATAAITERDAFSDAHDPSVPSAYIGQLIYLNSRILEMVDGILENHEHDPIIVITADHGRKLEGWGSPHAILAAFTFRRVGIAYFIHQLARSITFDPSLTFTSVYN